MSLNLKSLEPGQTLTVNLEFSQPLGPDDAYTYDALVSGLELALDGMMQKIVARVSAKHLEVRVRGPLDGVMLERFESVVRALVRSLSWRAGNPTGRPGDEVPLEKRRRVLTAQVTMT